MISAYGWPRATLLLGSPNIRQNTEIDRKAVDAANKVRRTAEIQQRDNPTDAEKGKVASNGARPRGYGFSAIICEATLMTSGTAVVAGRHSPISLTCSMNSG